MKLRFQDHNILTKDSRMHLASSVRMEDLFSHSFVTAERDGYRGNRLRRDEPKLIIRGYVRQNMRVPP